MRRFQPKFKKMLVFPWWTNRIPKIKLQIEYRLSRYSDSVKLRSKGSTQRRGGVLQEMAEQLRQRADLENLFLRYLAVLTPSVAHAGDSSARRDLYRVLQHGIVSKMERWLCRSALDQLPSKQSQCSSPKFAAGSPWTPPRTQ